MDELLTATYWAGVLNWGNAIALLTLTGIEIVLGIDNVVFITILTGRLPERSQAGARRIGLLMAMLMRIGLLLAISWIMGLTEDLFTIQEHGFSGRDLILLGGGLFLIGKATLEIHDKIEGEADHTHHGGSVKSVGWTILQVMLLDLVFSLDSVITAVGMVEGVPIMITAIVVAVGVMLVFAGVISRFIERHPTMKMLALAFLLLIGVVLVADGFKVHIAKHYIYFAMVFSLFVELLNLKVIKRALAKARQERGDKR